MSGERVLVVGAGPSGLAAAWRLRQAGHDVTLFDSRDRVGGQMKTVHRDGFVIETATTILPRSYESVLRLAAEAGMTDELIEANPLMGFGRDGKVHHLRADHLALDAARSKLLSTRSKLGLWKFAADLARMRPTLNYHDLSSAGAFDSETPHAYCERRGLSGEVFDYLIEPIVRAGAGVPADVISVVEFFFLADKVLGSPMVACDRGYSSLAEKLAEGFDVRLGATVVEITESADEVTLTYEDADGQHVETAAGAVVSSMGNRVPDIVPQLAPERAQFLRELTYTSCITFNLALSRKPDEKAAFLVAPRTESNKIFAAIVEHNKAPGRAPEGKGLVGIYGMNGWSVESIDKSDEEIIADAMPDAEKLVPGLSDHVEFSLVNRWYPVLVYSHPGLYRKLGRFHATRPLDSRIHLAGSYNSSSNVNTATVNGERAAKELADRLAGRVGPAATPMPPVLGVGLS